MTQANDSSKDLSSKGAPGGKWAEAIPLAELPVGRVCQRVVGGHTLAIGHGSQGPFAVADACAHEGASLGEGSLVGDTLTCPMHGWKYNCSTGGCDTDPRFCQKRYETKVEDGRVMVLLPAPERAKKAEDPATDLSQVEVWKAAKHGLDAWDDILRHAQEATPMSAIQPADLERMKWFGYYNRKTNDFDRYMMRVRIPGCELTSAQMRVLAFIAYESGYSILDITTRGNIQIQGLTIQKLPGIRAAMDKVDLDARQSGHDNVRNVSASPWSGLDPLELLDTRPLCLALNELILGNREFSDLPRKFNLATYGSSPAPTHAWTQDICFAAARTEKQSIAYHLLLGGSQGQTPTLGWCAPVWVEPHQAVDVAAATLRVFRRLGYRHNRTKVRFHFLMERLGNMVVLEEIEKELGYTLRRTASRPPLPLREENFVGWLKQKDGEHWALGVCVPVGRLSWDQAQGLADLAETFGSGTLRTTLDQDLIIPDIPEASRGESELRLAALGLSADTDAYRRNIVACTGKQFCNLAITETKGFALQLMAKLRRRSVSLLGVSIHFSGCPNSCGMTLTADVGLQGTKVRLNGQVIECFDVYFGGGVGRDGVLLARLYEKAVPFNHLGFFLEKHIRQWHSERTVGETFSDFWRKRMKDHNPSPHAETIPKWICTKCEFKTHGEVPPTSCPICSAIRSKFEPLGLPIPEVLGKRLLIVGGGIAAHTAAREARKHDSTLAITLLSEEPEGFYNRLNLTRFLNKELERVALFEFPAAWYQENRIELKTKAEVISLDPNERTLMLGDGQCLPFDACILAHGSAAALPDSFRALDGLRPLRTLGDLEHLLPRLRPGAACVVVGGGVLGIEAAVGLAGRGACVTLVERGPGLMPRQLVLEAAQLLQEKLEAKGISVRTGLGIKGFQGQGAVTGVELEDGTVLSCELALVSTGVRPNIDWVKTSGIDCRKGIVVDDAMRTNAPGVFACGDVAEWRGEPAGLWSIALEQATVAAAAACGKEAQYQAPLALTQLKCLGWVVLSMGEIAEDGGGIESRTEADAAASRWKRVIYRNGYPVGAILLGSTAGMGDLRSMVEQGRTLEALSHQVLPHAHAGV